MTILIALLSCERQKEEFEKFVFDNKQISTKDIHRYEFDEGGRTKTVHTTNILFMAGIPVDSSTHVKQYEYNERGKVTRIFDALDSTWQARFCNDFDSLVADYTINNYGDTIRLTEIDYTNGKSHRKIERILTMKFPTDFKDLEEADLRNYDTLLFITEFIFEGDLQKKSLSLDKNRNVTEEVELVYEDGRKAKAITYSFLGDRKYITGTTIFYDGKKEGLDLLTIGPQGDTLEFQMTIFQDKGKITMNYMGQLNMQDISYYDRNDRHIGSVFLDLNEKTKTVHSYKHDDNGNVIEESSYRERIK